MVHTIFVAAEFWLILGESQHMGRRVDFGYYLHAALLGEYLKVDKLLLGVVAVASCKSGKSLTLEAKCSLCLHPVATEKLSKTVVVKVNLQGVHFII